MFFATYKYNILLVLPKGFFRTNLQYEYKIMTKTTDLNYDETHFLEIKTNDLKLLPLIITTNDVKTYCSCMLRRRYAISSLILPLHTF